ncbi:Aspartate-semialdehyde dehydrogenase [bioreactor metagenome]|uniref:aspartate-semialdehyde dehydrogenase n=1 Tax=bioreactor metagenome TaxID=1076179 RepID=A0A645FCJ9_9ZZZZ
MNIVLGAAKNSVAKAFAPSIVAAGAVFIDNSSAFRLDPDVPLIVPEINPEDLLMHHGIIANPNCSTIITLMAVNPLHRLSKIRALYISTYQATSGAGENGPKELLAQTKALLNDEPIISRVFPYQIAYNLIPQIGDFNDLGYTAEEMKLQNEGRKILHSPILKVACTCVRVPVIRSHSISVVAITEEKITVEDAKKAIMQADGCQLTDDPQQLVYPMPLATSDQDQVYVGRIRKDLVNANGINLWCCGDQLRKGAATNAVQIAEYLIKY